MSRIEPKMTQHSKNQDTLNSPGERQSIATNAKMTDVGIMDKNLKAAITKML